jgi:hypothetical protein
MSARRARSGELARQLTFDLDLERNRQQALRDQYTLDAGLPTAPDACPAAIGRAHDVTMRGPDGVYRCWYCCQTRAAITAAAAVKV